MKTKLLTVAFSLLAILVSCTREASRVFEGEVLREFTIPLSALNINPAPNGRKETGTFTLQVLSDNSLRYQFILKDLVGDAGSGAQIRAGDPLTNGPVVLDLFPRIAYPLGTGIFYGVRQSLIDSLLNDKTDLYVNVISNSLSNGLVRGQIRNPVTFAADVQLNGSNEVPPVTTTATGTALIRLTQNRTLFSQVTIKNLETNDALLAAHIHRGAPGVNGPIIVDLAKSAADFGVIKSTVVDSSTYTILLNERVYVNVHSVRNPAGKIRGQIR